MHRSVPFRLGAYDCQQRLGGNYGEVYFAVDVRSLRNVLVKIMAPFGQPSMFRQRFLVEARVACQCVHPNLIQTYEAGEIGGEYVIVTEIPQGDTLRGLLNEGVYESEDDCLSIGWQVAHTMAFLHGFGIIHRDLKPENIVIGPDGSVKLFDFGIARLTESKLPTEGDIVGTPLYMAPEQVRGEQAGKLSDIYSFGVLLFHLFTRAYPYKILGHEDLYNAIVHREPNLTALVERRLRNSALVDLIAACLRKNPAERPQSFDQIESILARAAQQNVPNSAAELRAMSLPPPMPRDGSLLFQSMQHPVMEPATAKFSSAPPPPPPLPPARQTAPVDIRVAAPSGKGRRGLVLGSVVALLVASLGAVGWFVVLPRIRGAVSTVNLSTPMQKVPAGPAMLGRDRELVQVPAFEIDQVEVSVKDYLDFARRTGRKHPDKLEDLDPQLPVVNVTYDDAEAFAKWVGKRLPTAKEWEKAARGDDGRKFPWGNEPLLERANIGNPDYLARVNARGDGASPYGVLNMLGNVWEWVDAPVQLSAEEHERLRHLFTPPLELGERAFQIRGGSFMHLTSAEGLEELIWDSASAPARTRRKDIGFRCARDLR